MKAIAGILLGLIIVVIGMAALDTATSTAPPSTVTMAKYNQAKEGMSYTQVGTIFGEPGKETGSSSVGGIQVKSYQWLDPYGRGIVAATFQDGRLVMKAQSGL